MRLLESTAKLDTVNHQVGGVFLNITQIKFEETKEAIISRQLKKYRSCGPETTTRTSWVA
jgi:hypothetical protein